MIKYLFFLYFGCTSILGFSQDSYEKPFDQINRKPGALRLYTLFPPTEKSAEKFDRLNTDFFFNSWIGDINGVTTKFYSIGHSINIMYDIPFGKTSRFGIGIGLGYTHYNVRHDGNFSFIKNPANKIDFSLINLYDGEDRWINRTVFNQIDIPFEFRIRAQKERKKFKFYPGFKLGYIFNSFEKWRINDKKYKELNFPDVIQFQYGPTFRIGIDNLFLFGSYNLTYLFSDTQSSQLQLFSVGISFGWF